MSILASMAKKNHRRRWLQYRTRSIWASPTEGLVRQNKPVLGIARGVQLINVAFGRAFLTKGLRHWQGLPFGTSHSIRLKGSVVEQLFGQASRINSVTVKVSRISRQISVRPPRSTRSDYRSHWSSRRSSDYGLAVASRIFGQWRKRGI